MRRRNRQSFTVPILEYGGGDGGAAEENKIELILFFIFVFFVMLCSAFFPDGDRDEKGVINGRGMKDFVKIKVVLAAFLA